MTLIETRFPSLLLFILLAFITAAILDNFLPLMPEMCEGDRFNSRLIVLSN